MGLASKLRQKAKYGLLNQYILDRVAAFGLGIRPYYLVQEGMDSSFAPVAKLPEGEECTQGFLSRDEVRQLAQHPECAHGEADLLARLDNGSQCFALKQGSQVMSYMWCNPNQLESWVTYPLESGEVYLFDAWTFKAYRGCNLAPYLRVKLYEALREEGSHTFYSVSDYFNNPAVKFKEKIGAKKTKLCMHLRLFKKAKINFQIREYSH